MSVWVACVWNAPVPAEGWRLTRRSGSPGSGCKWDRQEGERFRPGAYVVKHRAELDVAEVTSVTRTFAPSPHNVK